MKIAVVGTGYVGLVTGTCFAETGNEVTCVDIDEGKVKRLSNGEITIYEPGLEKLFLRNVRENRLRFTTDIAHAVEDALLIFLALPTPPGEDGAADLFDAANHPSPYPVCRCFKDRTAKIRSLKGFDRAGAP